MTQRGLLGVACLASSFGISFAAVFGASLLVALALTVLGLALVLAGAPRR